MARWSSRRTVVVPPEVRVLAPFVDAGVFGAFEVQLASTIARLQPGAGDDVILALTVAARAPGFGHVCVDLDSAVHQISLSDDADEPAVSLPWPSAEGWTRAVAASPLVMQPALGPTVLARPLVWDEGHLYLQRYWHYEVSVARALADRAEQSRISHGQANATGDIDRALAVYDDQAQQHEGRKTRRGRGPVRAERVGQVDQGRRRCPVRTAPDREQDHLHAPERSAVLISGSWRRSAARRGVWGRVPRG